MKVEIELSELEKMREELSEKTKRVEELEKKISGLNEEEMKKKAVDLSYRLFNEYMRCVFEKLGFSGWRHDYVEIPYNLERYVGKSWFNSERIDVDIHAQVSRQFRSAFLTIGVITKDDGQEL